MIAHRRDGVKTRVLLRWRIWLMGLGEVDSREQAQNRTEQIGGLAGVVGRGGRGQGRAAEPAGEGHHSQDVACLLPFPSEAAGRPAAWEQHVERVRVRPSKASGRLGPTLAQRGAFKLRPVSVVVYFCASPSQ